MAIRTLLAAVLTMAGTVPAGTAADTTPPTVPGPPVATQVTETSALLTWRPSTDDTGVTGYEIWYQRPDDTGFHNNTPVPSYRFTGLTPDTTYTWVVRASDGRDQSGFSAPVTFRTDPAPQESEPPTAPGAPVVTEITGSSLGLTWVPSTDNASAPTYLVHARAEGIGHTTVVGADDRTSTQVTNLIPDLSYDLHVVARDVSGNVSAPSPTVRQRIASDPTADCRVTFQPAAAGQPPTLWITNTGPVALPAWSSRFRFSGGQRLWDAGYNWAQYDRDVVLWWSGWSDQFSVGESVPVALHLSAGTLDAPPNDVTLNGVPCTVG
ncbi:fibronectin type III domain-containing protein [Plantactinospora sonchi]|uniref:Fibronectin type III domain-containing protein n=1 Tax=Plantactinospora sonchi TaxID=1544735 RepID=A0ABU7RSG1_9ACTN